MTVQNNGFEVKVRLQPTVRQINRAPQKLTPAVDSAAKRGRLSRFTRAWAMALRHRVAVGGGDGRGHADHARRLCNSRERISESLGLSCLPPDIQEGILPLPRVPAGQFPIREG